MLGFCNFIFLSQFCTKSFAFRFLYAFFYLCYFFMYSCLPSFSPLWSSKTQNSGSVCSTTPHSHQRRLWPDMTREGNKRVGYKTQLRQNFMLCYRKIFVPIQFCQ